MAIRSKPISPSERLVSLANEALVLAQRARKYSQSLAGNNFYATKLVALRVDATNVRRELPLHFESSEDFEDAFDKTFAARSSVSERTQAVKRVHLLLGTARETVDVRRLELRGVFPLETLEMTKRGYIVAIGRQMNGSYTSGWYDACANMMRRLLEAAIIEAFEAKGIETKIQNSKGDFVQLTELISIALAERSWNLSRNVKKELPQLRDLGHKSAHGRHYIARKMYIDELLSAYRDAVEAFLHEARLL